MMGNKLGPEFPFQGRIKNRGRGRIKMAQELDVALTFSHWKKKITYRIIGTRHLLKTGRRN